MQTHSSEYLHSSLREKILEHLFIGEVLKYFWINELFNVELLRAEVDSGGYDIVISYEKIVRHIQLKASKKNSRTSQQKVNLSLGKKPSGCVIWMQFDAVNLQLGPFFWFGGEPGQQLPDIGKKTVTRHTKGNASGVKLERPNIRILKKRDFEQLASIYDVMSKLFGDLNTKNQRG